MINKILFMSIYFFTYLITFFDKLFNEFLINLYNYFWIHNYDASWWQFVNTLCYLLCIKKYHKTLNVIHVVANKNINISKQFQNFLMLFWKKDINGFNLEECKRIFTNVDIIMIYLYDNLKLTKFSINIPDSIMIYYSSQGLVDKKKIIMFNMVEL